jgi:hypothetical protein
MKSNLNPPGKKSRRRRLVTQEDCRRALAWVATELERRAIEVPRARAMTSAIGTLSTVVERTELETRMDDLQAQLAALQVGQVKP